MKPMPGRKLRSRGYPAIALPEAVALLEHLPRDLFETGYDRSSLTRSLGYTSERSGIADRKVAALGHFGLLSLRDGLYSLSALGLSILNERATTRGRAAVREACLNPHLFRELIQRYDKVGRVPYRLATVLSLDHGIQDNVRDEVAHIFMASAEYAGILDGDGVFRHEYFEETEGRCLSLPAPAHGGAPAEREVPQVPEPEDKKTSQNLQFFLTEQKQAELRLPARLNEQDILLLKAQIDFLELQVRLSRPDQPVRLGVVRGIRNRE